MEIYLVMERWKFSINTKNKQDIVYLLDMKHCWQYKSMKCHLSLELFQSGGEIIIDCFIMFTVINISNFKSHETEGGRERSIHMTQILLTKWRDGDIIHAPSWGLYRV